METYDHLIIFCKKKMTTFEFCVRLFDKMNKRSHAAGMYLEYVSEYQRLVGMDSGGAGLPERGDLAQAYRYLANHYNNINDLDQASLYCNKCLEFDEVRTARRCQRVM